MKITDNFIKYASEILSLEATQSTIERIELIREEVCKLGDEDSPLTLLELLSKHTGDLYKRSLENGSPENINKEFEDVLMYVFDRGGKYGDVYDLPLNINYIGIRGNVIEVYLYRPGLFIGKGGKDFDKVLSIMRKKFPESNLSIKLIETKNRKAEALMYALAYKDN